MIGLTANVKDFFLDRIKVATALEKGEKRALSKAGAYIRRADQTSIRYRKKSSEAGSPPSAHKSQGFTRERKNKKTGKVSRQPKSPLRELIYFAWDPGTKSVVIGPVIFKGSKVGGGIAPRLIEEGGTGPGVSDGRKVMKRYKARPHTGPAYRKVLPQIPAMFKGQVK